MIIQPSIRSNVFLNAHPVGCEKTVQAMIQEAQALPSFQGPKTALIIGGSSGYGLASRIALAFAGGAHTINVSTPGGPSEKRTGKAGWWNNLYFQKHAAALGTKHIDILGDAFSSACKDDVIAAIQEKYGTIDLVVYSLASGVRINETTDTVVRSSIKTIGEPLEGHTINVVKETLEPLTVEGASDQEIADTVYVMGGGDWADWIERLMEAKLCAPGFKTLSYTYIGSEVTARLYREGTLGKAKEDLEQTALTLSKTLQAVQGEALIASAKAIVSKASVFIPQMPLYVACLFEVMRQAKTHETVLEHTHRLMATMVYGKQPEKDAEGRLRVDAWELKPDIQAQTQTLMETLSSERLLALEGTRLFIEEFYRIHGFGFPDIDYDQDIDLFALAASLQKTRA